MSSWDGIKVLTFDFYGTVFDWEGSLRGETAKILTAIKEDLDAAQFIQQWRARQLQYCMVNTLIDRGKEKFLILTELALKHTLKTHDIHAAESEVAVLTSLWESLEPFPEVALALNKLHSKYKLVIASNGDKESLSKNYQMFKLPFDDVFSSEIPNAYKPSPKFYHKLLDTLSLRAEQVMHIARSQFDVFGSKAIGLNVTWVNRGEEPLSEGFYNPDHEVHDFDDLVSIAL